MRFDELGLSYDVLDALDDMHFEECTPIQEQAIPIIFDRKDLIAVAQTGTGKTAAYLLPVIDMLADEPESKNSVSCIVMSPTRELAQQIDRQLEGFSYYLPISSLAIYGGTDGKEFARQQTGLMEGADVVIATPGRLIAHLQLGKIDLSKVRYFILDEADRMLDMGFFDDIMQIVRHLPQERQTLMFSATMPPKIQQLAETILRDPAEIKLAVSKPSENIAQSACVCYEKQKTPVLRHLFKTISSQRVIVFSSSKLKVKDLAKSLRSAHYKVGEMHSDLEQARRDEVMRDFCAGRIDILVATDIVARGIDIDDITLVVNYDVPREAEDYVHRIGRTARAGAGGSAVTLIGPDEQWKFGRLEDFLGFPVRKQELPAELGETPAYEPQKTGRGDRSGRGGNRSGKGGGKGARGGKRQGGKPARRGKDSAPQGNAQAAAPVNDPTAPRAEKEAASDASRKPKGKGRGHRRPKRKDSASSGGGEPSAQ